MARVLVTGATGFIGKHLVDFLVQRGDQVRCLARKPTARFRGATIVHGDITVPESLDAAVTGVDIVYHLAGATVVSALNHYRAINTLGTHNLGEACARLTSPPVLVYLSSLAAAGPSPECEPRTEETLLAPVSAYGRSKLMGERRLRRLAGRLPVTIVRPPSVFGPGDHNTLALFQTVRWGVHFIPGSPRQQLAFLYVADLIEALPQAAFIGERLDSTASVDDAQGCYYLAMDEQPTFAELGTLAGQVMRRPKVRLVTVPLWIGKTLGRVNDFVARVTGVPLMLTSDKMREALAGSWTCRSDKAKRQLNFSCWTGLRDGFEKTVAWYRQHGWL
jgi:nucleoside-diphosphate-sugar epimerase